MQEIYWQITKVKRPFIFSADEFTSITNEARKNAKSMEPFVPNFASTFVVRNLAQRIIADYYLKFDRPGIPYKVVTKIEDAVKWITENFEVPPAGIEEGQ